MLNSGCGLMRCRHMYMFSGFEKKDFRIFFYSSFRPCQFDERNISLLWAQWMTYFQDVKCVLSTKTKNTSTTKQKCFTEVYWVSHFRISLCLIILPWWNLIKYKLMSKLLSSSVDKQFKINQYVLTFLALHSFFLSCSGDHSPGWTLYNRFPVPKHRGQPLCWKDSILY